MSPREIKRIRTTMQLTQREFAAEIGVALPTVKAWERGVNKPSETAALRLKLLTCTPAGNHSSNWDPAVIVRLRNTLQLTRRRFAARLGVSAATVRDWETGRREPSARNQRALVKLQGDLENFCFDEWTPERIRVLRCLLGLSQQQLAHWIGCCTRTISAWEQGKAKPHRGSCTKLDCLAATIANNTRPNFWSPEEIRHVRRRLRLTGVQFADLLGVGVSSVWEWEKGTRTPSRQSRKRIAGAAGLLSPLDAAIILVEMNPDKYVWDFYGVGAWPGE